MKYKIIALFIIASLFYSCTNLNHNDLYVFHCDDAKFTFSVLERGDASIFIFGNKDSVYITPARDGNYAGIDFCVPDSMNTIYFKRELIFVEQNSDTIVGRLVVPQPYKTVSSKYKIKYIVQELPSLDYDFTVLGENYWEFTGNVSEHTEPFGFCYSRNGIFQGDVEVIKKTMNVTQQHITPY